MDTEPVSLAAKPRQLRTLAGRIGALSSALNHARAMAEHPWPRELAAFGMAEARRVVNLEARLTAARAEHQALRLPPGGRCAARCRDGHPCGAPRVKGRARCKLHGGRSTGPRTAEGKARALGALRRSVEARRAPSVEAST